VARALVVDDDPSIRTVLTDLCRAMGLEVEAAVDGVDALEKLRANGADVLLLDLAMPRLDGFGVLEALRDEAFDPDPAVIIVTSSADAGGKIRGTELGALDFVEKPFRVADLRRRIERVLNVAELEAKLRQAESQLWELRTTDQTMGVGRTNQLFEVLDGEFRWALSSEKALSCVVVSDERCVTGTARDPEQDRERLHCVAATVESGLVSTHRLFRVDVAELVVVLPGTPRDALEGLVSEILATIDSADGLDAADFAVGGASHPHVEITQASHLYRAANVSLAQARTRANERVVLFDGFGS